MGKGKKSVEQTYKYSYKVGDNLLSSLSVYNVGYQQCGPEQQWGPGIRDHYCIHHIISGKGTYVADKKVYHLGEGDSFILYPDTEVKYYADPDDPWEYAWAGFMGTDAAVMVRATDFARKRPVIGRDKIPGDLIWRQLEQIYQVRGTTYEAAAAMTGALYTMLSVFIHYAEKKRKRRPPAGLCGAGKGLYCIQLLLSDHGGGCSGLYGDQQKLSLSCISSISEAVPKRISDGISNPSGMPSSQGDRAFRCIHCVFGRI